MRVAHRVVHRGLHPRRASHAAGGRAAARRAPREHGVQRALSGPDVPGGHRPRQAQPRGDLPGDEAPDRNLRRLNRSIDVPLIQLIDASGAPADSVAHGIKRTYDDLATRTGLRRIATYADGIGPDKSRIVPTDWATGCRRRGRSCATCTATTCSCTR